MKCPARQSVTIEIKKSQAGNKSKTSAEWYDKLVSLVLLQPWNVVAQAQSGTTGPNQVNQVNGSCGMDVGFLMPVACRPV